MGRFGGKMFMGRCATPSFNSWRQCPASKGLPVPAQSLGGQSSQEKALQVKTFICRGKTAGSNGIGSPPPTTFLAHGVAPVVNARPRVIAPAVSGAPSAPETAASVQHMPQCSM
mmetsp:Transcript_26346/g.75618  ORF Transcript_26346/g.75618 Transcript_26346/m.75618 type:complete len:114 (+) Transcript_26346:1181-1522(+)